MRLIRFIFLLPIFLWAQGHLLISEVMVPSSTDAGKAFIEIYNPSTSDLDLSSVYLSNSKAYYQVVAGVYSSKNSDFLVKFPTGASIPGKGTRTVVLDGTAFSSAYTAVPDFEIAANNNDIPDMTILQTGDNLKLETSGGMIILFKWDGQTDLVQDVDYMPWGFFKTNWMDKSGVTIDGPDTNSDASAYLTDLATGSQKGIASLDGIQSLQRNGIQETDEITAGGNGLSGHNEATENWQSSFVASVPSPGSFSEVEGDGAGTVTVDSVSVLAGTTVDLTFSLTGTAAYTLASVQIEIPASWAFPGNAADVQFSGTGLSSATLQVTDHLITINNAQLSDIQTGEMTVSGLTTPAESESSVFFTKSAVSGGNLTNISAPPRVQVIKILTIADVQNNSEFYKGKTVTLRGVVAVGAGITSTSWTDVYIQDASGRGINVYRAGEIVANLDRGNEIEVTGEVAEFSNTTEITNFTFNVLSSGNEVPAIPFLSIAQASDSTLEGTMVETAGVITEKYVAGTGQNLVIKDAGGSIGVRIWDTANIDLNSYIVGDTVAVRAIVGTYRAATQLTLGYSQDIFITSLVPLTDGSGKVVVTPSTVDKGSITELTFSFTATTDDTIGSVSINVPTEWQWAQSTGAVSMDGAFSAASVTLENGTLLFNDVLLFTGSPGTVTLTAMTAPDADTVSTFIVKTAGLNGALAMVKSTPIVIIGTGTNIPTIPIADARKLANGSSIAIKGTVVIGAGVIQMGRTSAYMADETGAGINIYSPGAVDPDIVRGNLIVLIGKIAIYNGVVEITSYTTTILKKDAPLPKPLSLQTEEATLVKYEGSWVNVKGVVKSKSSGGGGTNIYLDDGSGEATIRVWDTAGLNLDSYQQGDYIDVTGAHGVYLNTGQILVGYAEDIQPVTFSGKPIQLDVVPKPFAPDRGEKMPITYVGGSADSHVTLRIYDMGGRLVTTLVDGKAIPLSVPYLWDGRNELGELVPIGTYILHFEVVDNESGKRQEKVAPIVVGTMLSR